MSEIAIRIDHLGKRYWLGRRDRYRTLRESLADLVRFPRRRAVSPASGPGTPPFGPEADGGSIWALRDVSFEIKRGETVGIIGHNGAGKSTLLRILSRITEPTVGWAELHGRVGSLLEVGTGFHPELTGRENIFLNGAILGMRREEVERKFEEIAAFAEVEKFLDTPVKRYSSGMYVRLAFAVAAHLELEILLVDEVLSVGDAAFQKKCLGKIEEVTSRGRTVILVSHNMAAIKSLTRTTLLLERGCVKALGETSAVVDQYLSSVSVTWRNGYYDGVYVDARRVYHEKYSGILRVTGVRLRDSAGQITSAHLEGSRVVLEVAFNSRECVKVFEMYVRIRSADGQLLFTCLPGRFERDIGPGKHTAVVSFDLGPVLPGHYRGDVVLLSNIPQDNVSPAFEFEVLPNPAHGQDFRTVLFGMTPRSDYSGLGIIRVRSAWESLRTEDNTS